LPAVVLTGCHEVALAPNHLISAVGRVTKGAYRSLGQYHKSYCW